MGTVLLILIIFMVFVSVFMKWTQKFSNPFLINYYIGVKGSGKSTLATKEAIKFQKNGQKVYSNFEIFGAYHIDPSDVGFYKVPPNSLLILDEVSLIWSNRDFKSFPREVEQFFRYCRKYKVYVRMYSQSFDVDLKIRNNVDNIFILVKLLNVFTIAKKVKRTIVLHGSSRDEDSGQRTSEGFVSENFSYDLPTTWQFCFIPRWVKFFNSFEAPELPKKEYFKFRYQKEAYLYKLTHYWGYKKDQMNDIYQFIKKKNEIERKAFWFTDYFYKLNLDS